MSSRQNWFWVLLAAGLLGFILLHNHFRHKPATGPTRVIPDLKASSVTAIQIHLQGQTEIRAERTNSAWMLTEPLVYPAQAISVENLLAALEKLIAATHITAGELKNRPEAEEEYGLGNPRATIILQGDFRERIAIGTNTAPGDQIFLKVGRDDGVYVVDSDLVRLIPKSAKDWRDTTFFDLTGVLPDHVSVTNGPRPFELLRAGSNNVWQLLKPGFPARADAGRVEEILQGLKNIRVHDFVTDEPKADLEAYGLQTPDLQLAFRSGTNLLGLLQFGKEATNSPHEVYARRFGQNSIVTVGRDLLDPWRSADKFRDPFLVSFNAPISAVEVHGQDSFLLTAAANQSWRVLPENLPADVSLVKELLANLASMQIVSFVRDVVPKAELGGYGLTNFSLEYVVKAGALYSPDEGPPSIASISTNPVLADIQFGSALEDKVFVQRADENSVYAVKLADFERLGSASWQFRERRIWTLDENDVANVTIKHAGRTRQINRRAQFEWSLAPNSQGMIEALAVDQTVKGLCSLSATAWVARGEQNRASYGLTNDNFVVTIELKNGNKHTIEFGRPTSSSFPYGAVKLDNDLWVFEVPLKLCRDIVAYLSIPANIH
jgi:hypothetical protein